MRHRMNYQLKQLLKPNPLAELPQGVADQLTNPRLLLRPEARILIPESVLTPMQIAIASALNRVFLLRLGVVMAGAMVGCFMINTKPQQGREIEEPDLTKKQA